MRQWEGHETKYFGIQHRVKLWMILSHTPLQDFGLELLSLVFLYLVLTLLVTRLLATKWGMIQNGGHGQNYDPPPVPLTLIQIHTSILTPHLCLHNWLQAFGIYHIFWNPIRKQLRRKSRPPHICHTGTPPICEAWRHSLKAANDQPGYSEAVLRLYSTLK